MKATLTTIIFLLQLTLVSGQIQFESIQEEGTWICAQDVEDGILLYGYNFIESAPMLALLDDNGNFVDSIILSKGVQAGKIIETTDSYIVFGMYHPGADTVLNFWKAVFSKDLDVQSLEFTPMDSLVTESGYDYLTFFNFTMEPESDTIFYTGLKGYTGWINHNTKEVFSKKQDISLITDCIQPRPSGSGYLISGYSIHLLDNDFNNESYFPFFMETLHCGAAGLDVEYISDTSFIFATHFLDGQATDYVNEDDYGVIVGVMTEDFEILAVDTILMESPGNWIILPFMQHILEPSTDSTFVVAGRTHPYYGNFTRLFFAKYTNTGERLFSHILFTPELYTHFGTRVLATSDGGCLIYGQRETITGDGFFYAIKLGPDGLVVGETSIPMVSSPLTAYPNPTSDRITFDIPMEHTSLSLELVDMEGRVVLRQKVNNQESISTSHLPKGMYGYRLLGPDGTVLYSGKMVKE